MREEPAIHLCKGCIGSAMFGVTMTAGEPRVVMFHLPVHGGNILHLLGNDSVAHSTAVRHFCCAPGCHMTGFTIPSDLGMRPDAAKDRIALGVQRTGVVQQSTPGISITGDHQCRDQGCENPRPCQAPQSTIVSHSPSRGCVKVRTLVNSKSNQEIG